MFYLFCYDKQWCYNKNSISNFSLLSISIVKILIFFLQLTLCSWNRPIRTRYLFFNFNFIGKQLYINEAYMIVLYIYKTCNGKMKPLTYPLRNYRLSPCSSQKITIICAKLLMLLFCRHLQLISPTQMYYSVHQQQSCLFHFATLPSLVFSDLYSALSFYKINFFSFCIQFRKHT